MMFPPTTSWAMTLTQAQLQRTAGWQPIENFAGSLSGGESAYAIYALYIDLPGNDRAGLFASISRKELSQSDLDEPPSPGKTVSVHWPEPTTDGS